MAEQAQRVNAAIANVASVSEENSASAEEVSAATEEMTAQVAETATTTQELSALATNLTQALERFEFADHTQPARTSNAPVPLRRVA